MIAFGAVIGTQTGIFSHTIPRDGTALGNDCASTSSLTISAPPMTAAGESIAVTVQLRNAQNQLDTGFRGTVQFASTDSNAMLPASYAFTAADAGSHTFNVTLRTAGERTLNAVVGGTIASRIVNVSPATPSQLVFLQSPESI